MALIGPFITLIDIKKPLIWSNIILACLFQLSLTIHSRWKGFLHPLFIKSVSYFPAYFKIEFSRESASEVSDTSEAVTNSGGGWGLFPPPPPNRVCGAHFYIIKVSLGHPEHHFGLRSWPVNKLNQKLNLWTDKIHQ